MDPGYTDWSTNLDSVINPSAAGSLTLSGVELMGGGGIGIIDEFPGVAYSGPEPHINGAAICGYTGYRC